MIPDIVSRFMLKGTPVGCIEFGSGHINRTYLVVTNEPHLYILQDVNTSTFPDAEGLMRNVIQVTEHIRRKVDDPRRFVKEGDLVTVKIISVDWARDRISLSIRQCQAKPLKPRTPEE